MRMHSSSPKKRGQYPRAANPLWSLARLAPNLSYHSVKFRLPFPTPIAEGIRFDVNPLVARGEDYPHLTRISCMFCHIFLVHVIHAILCSPHRKHVSIRNHLHIARLPSVGTRDSRLHEAGVYDQPFRRASGPFTPGGNRIETRHLRGFAE